MDEIGGLFAELLGAGHQSIFIEVNIPTVRNPIHDSEMTRGPVYHALTMVHIKYRDMMAIEWDVLISIWLVVWNSFSFFHNWE